MNRAEKAALLKELDAKIAAGNEKLARLRAESTVKPVENKPATRTHFEVDGEMIAYNQGDPQMTGKGNVSMDIARMKKEQGL